MDGNSMEAALEFSKANIPVMFFGMPQPGATSPVTLAGSLVVNNAEVLACLTLTQLAHPGAPVIYGAGIAVFDMKTLKRAGGGPEHGLTGAAAGEIAKHYNPLHSRRIRNNSKNPKRTSMLRKTCKQTPNTRRMRHDSRNRTTRRLHNPSTRRNNNRRRNSENSLQNTPRNRSKRKHTLTNLKREHFIPELTDRRSYETWLKTGRKDITTTAKEKVKTILQKHKPQPLEEDIQREVKSIIEKAERELKHTLTPHKNKTLT